MLNSFAFRPFLLLYRARLRWAAVISLAFAVLILMWTSAESPGDFAVLWHHFCGCPPDPTDAFAMLNLTTFTCCCLGLLMGIGVGTGVGTQNSAAIASGQGMWSEPRLLLTRPMPRRAVILTPALIAFAVIGVMPALAMLALLAWLRLVHAPAMGHLLDDLRLIPAVASLGMHPTLVATVRASHFAWHYAASVAVGVCAYAAFYAARWTVHSRRRWVRLSSSFIFLLMFLPSLQMFSPWVRAFIFLVPPHPHDLGYLPPASFVAAHLAFAFAVLYGCWTIARDAEL